MKNKRDFILWSISNL